MKEVSLNLSLSSGSLKDLIEILDLHRHQIVQSLVLLSSLVTSLFKTAEIKHYLHHMDGDENQVNYFTNQIAITKSILYSEINSSLWGEPSLSRLLCHGV